MTDITIEEPRLAIQQKSRTAPVAHHTTEPEVTILMPCLNEAATVGECVRRAMGFLYRSGTSGEVLVADNGSIDGSVEIARRAGARVVHVPQKGYGAALIGGISAARGKFVIMGDADQSYDFGALDAFVERLRSGDALVMGNRFRGGVRPGAMPILHRYLGNPVLSFLGRLLFGSPIGDFHCGLRGFDRAAIASLNLTSTGMEFASEMVVKATLADLNISEVPTILSPDGRDRKPHLNTWRDGWRHLRFLLMMSPRWLLLYPGLLILASSLLVQLALLRGAIHIGPTAFGIHTMLYSAGGLILGLQLMLFSLIARSVGCVRGLLPVSEDFSRFVTRFSLEGGVILGFILLGAGLVAAVYSVAAWLGTGLSALDPERMMRTAIPSVTLMVAGTEIVFASFVLALVGIKEERLVRRGG